MRPGHLAAGCGHLLRHLQSDFHDRQDAGPGSRFEGAGLRSDQVNEPPPIGAVGDGKLENQKRKNQGEIAAFLSGISG
jgi:hypothetical protein